MRAHAALKFALGVALSIALGSGALLGLQKLTRSSLDHAPQGARGNASDQAPDLDEHAFESVVCPRLTPLQRCNVRATDGAGVTEIDVAVDPADPDHWVAVAKAVNDLRTLPQDEEPSQTPPSDYFTAYAVTFDGGQSWTWDYIQNMTPVAQAPIADRAGHAHAAASDPTVAFTGRGNVIVSTLGIEDVGNPVEVRIHLSTDGGRTFQRVSDAFEGDPNATVPADKPWIEVDRDRGRVYLVTAGDPPGNGTDEKEGVYVATSEDEGRNWTDPTLICECDTPHFALAENGSVHLVAMERLQLGNATILYTNSTDGGRTWADPVEVARHDGVHHYAGANTRGFRATNLPVIAVGQDREEGPPPLYVAWGDHPEDNPQPPCPLSGLCLAQTPDWNIYLTKSTDGGSSWPDPVRVNDASTENVTAAVNPMVETGPRGGVHVVWADQRKDPTGLSMEIRHDFSWNGSSFGEDLLVSDVPTVPGPNLHDYLGLEATGEQAYLAWPDRRAGTSDIMTARIR